MTLAEKATQTSLSSSGNQVLALFFALAGLLMPYVANEPALVDFVLIIAALYFMSRTGAIQSNALALSLIYLIFYMSSGLVSLLAGRENELKFVRYYIVEIYLLFILLITYSIVMRYPDLIVKFLKYYCVGAIISSIAVLAIYLAVPSYDEIYRDAARIRLKGFFKDPNVLGPYLIFPSILLLATPTSLGFKSRWVTLGILPMALLMLLTLSRASIGSFVGSAILFVIIRFLSRPTLKVALIAISFSLFGSMYLAFRSDVLVSTIMKFDDFRMRMSLQSYDASRFYDIKHAFTISAPKFFGLGPASYESMHSALSPHNLFVAKLADGGWIPAVMICWLVVYPTYLSFKDYIATRKDIYLVFFITLIAHLVMAAVINPHHWRHLLLLTVLIIAASKLRVFEESVFTARIENSNDKKNRY